MKDDNNKAIKRKRPLSHNPLLKFHHDDNFLYDKKFMNEEMWLQKYNLKNLREKWNQKVQTNFLKMDIKFPTTNHNPEKNKIIYRGKIKTNDLYLIPNSLPYFSYLKNKKYNCSFYHNEKDKYNDKISYYLSNKNPWNNRTSIEINKENTNKNYNVHERLIKDLNIRNKIKNNNESKNISVKCIYYNNKYLQKKEKLKDLMDKYLLDINTLVRKKYIKEIKMKKQSKNFFIQLLIFKEVMKLYNELFNIAINKANQNIFNKHLLKRNNSDINLQIDKNENNNQNSKNIYEKLFVIINYLKDNKSILDNIKNRKDIAQNYFDVFEKDELLKDKDINYIKYIKNFGINNNLKTDIKIFDNNKKDLLYYKKKNGSCINLNSIPFQKRRYSEYNITYYHPGTYYLFNEGGNEFHAWSCCMNDDKKSRGCCKRTERIPYFNYDIIT